MTKEEIPQMQLVDNPVQVAKPKIGRRKGQANAIGRTAGSNPATGAEPSVALMLQKVIDGGITNENVAALESLVGLYDRMQAKNAEREFNQAFAKLQSELMAVNATRQVPNKDGSVRYRFAPFEDIMAEVQPKLVANGFSVSFNARIQDGGRIVSICTLRHVGGFSQSNEFAVRIGGGPPGSTETQADGAAKTYAKRGALCDALNIVVEHDDDARMIGQPIGKALAEDLRARVLGVGSNEDVFLKYAGVHVEPGFAPTFDDYAKISDERWPALDELLKRKESAKAAREKLSPEGEWK